jgi:hypothetical protein
VAEIPRRTAAHDVHRAARVKVRTGLLLLMTMTAACGEDPDSAPGPGGSTLAPPDPSEGVQFAMEVTAQPNEEIWKCQISQLEGKGMLPVHRVRSVQTPNIHHMDLMTIVNSGVPTKPGIYDCGPLYAEHPDLMEELILFAAQRADVEVTLPEGVAAMVPAGLTLMQEVHFVNASSETRTVSSRINAYTMPKDDVKGTIWGGATRDVHLHIPPNAETKEWIRCVMTDDVDLLFVATHTHQLAYETHVKLFDGKNVGAEIYENVDWQSPQLKDLTDAPLHIAKGEGLELSCHYRNTTSETVEWGFAAKDEMCNLAYVFTPGESRAKCEIVESNDGLLDEEIED